MTQDLSDLHGELARVAKDLLAGPTAGDWSSLVKAGWPGLEVPEHLGGSGASFAETAVVLQEMGRAAADSPLLGTAVLGVGALNLVEPADERDELLRRIAAGEALVAVTPGTGDDISEIPFKVDGQAVLRGCAGFVPDAAGAERILALALDGNGDVALVNLDPRAEGVAVEPQPVVDATRQLATVVADGIRLNDSSIWKLAGDPQAVVDRGALAMACDSLGLAEAMLEATVEYSQARHQFGRPIGSFQAVKHACSDMVVSIELSKALVGAAVDALSAGRPDASVAVSMAKSYACQAAVDVSGKAMQLHGGIGYTWERGIHVYLKRAVLNRALFGSPTAHRRRLAARYKG